MEAEEKFNLIKEFIEADGRNFEEECLVVYTMPTTKQIRCVMPLEEGLDKLMKKFSEEPATKDIHVCLKLKIH